jgi:extracellular elastinolytic metalloproteinase
VERAGKAGRPKLRPRRALRRSSVLAAAVTAVVVGLLPSSALGVAQIGATAKPDLNTNRGLIAPTAAQQRLVAGLGAHATWNRFGTPGSLIKARGYLATGLTGSPVEAARSFLETNKALFKLQSSKNLELVNDVTLPGTKAHAVLFAQRFGELVADWDGLIAVGVVDGKIAYVSSSAAAGQTVSGAVKLTAADAWTAAARDVGVPTGAISGTTQKDGWTYFDAAGLTKSFGQNATKANDTLLPAIPTLPALPSVPAAAAGSSNPTSVLTTLQGVVQSALAGGTQTSSAASNPVDVGAHQGAKLVAFPTLTGVRPAWLVNVVDLRSVTPVGYQTMVDAESGAILFRHNAVQEASQASSAQQPAFTFTGEYGPPPACGPVHPFAVDSAQKSIVATASALNPGNDIILTLLDPAGTVVGSSDTATSPEAVVYQDPKGADLATGNWAVQVCPYVGAPLTPVPNQLPPYTYVAGVAVTTASATLPTLPRPLPPTLVTNNPRWAFFASFPAINYTATAQNEGCWKETNDGVAQPKPCETIFASPFSPFGWDVIPRTNQSTLTTRGNNAFTAEDWVNPVAPAEQRSPVSSQRYYDRNFPGGNFVWTNSWYRAGCDPASLTDPTRNNGDIDAATTNLFVMHNRFHDFSYGLGFTEQTYNAQLDNLDNGDRSAGPYPYGREGDPELGDAQAGALTGGQPSLQGRDNANQLTLNDGTPPITNQYLWQPLASAFYAPCVDGSFDLSVAGHEYTHLISNRMVGGPDAGLSGLQSGSMGESWSDLDALEYLQEYGLAGKQGENPWSLGAYATGNPDKGIRDYALNENPLNYSDVGFDTTGPEVHADGEIWNGVNYEVRQELVKRYGAGDLATNIACAKGEQAADRCPGGRRWIQLVYDAFLLEQANVSMVDARDAMLAADKLRFGGANQTELWRAFAHRGLGAAAVTKANTDDQPTPGFDSAVEPNGTVSFVTVAKDGDAAGSPVKASVYVGDYQARVTPIADTDAATTLGNTAQFVPGTYAFVVQAPGYGLVKFTRTLDASASTLTIALPTNWASTASDATASGDGVNQSKLIDDNEATNWASLSGAVAGKQVTVTLAGRHVLASARVSALNHPSTCDGITEQQGVCVAGSGKDPDPTSQNRFSALRSFKIEACDSSVKNCALDKNWVVALQSAADAFPAARPRPVAPDVNLRSFDLHDTAATIVRIVVKANQCTGGPDFQGDQDNDPSNNSDCKSSANATKVRAAELQVVSSQPTITSAAGTTTVAVVAPAAGGSAGSAPVVSMIGAPSGAKSAAAATASSPTSGTAAALKTKLVRINARGAIASKKAQAVFSLVVNAARGGSLRYLDGARGLSVRSTRIQTVFVDYRTKTATITGKGIVGKKPVRFVVNLTDRARGDAFAIKLSNGYHLGGKLLKGTVTIA